MKIKEKITAPNIITSIRLIGAIIMALPYFEILSLQFFVIYSLCGVTDVLDGFVARMTKKTSEFGAKLDSVSDLCFYGVMLFKLLPMMLGDMPKAMPVMIAILLAIRVCSYLIAAFRYKKFASLHTYMNKASGFSCFVMPYLLLFMPHKVVYIIVFLIALVAGLEELIIHSTAQDYTRRNRTAIKTVKKD